MAATAITGQDVVVLNSRLITSFADGDCGVLEYPNDIADSKVGKNGNAIIAQNNMGYLADLTLRLLLGSSDDQFLNSLMQLQFQDFSGFTLMTCTFTKRVGDGAGNNQAVKIPLTAGFFKKQVPMKTNADGDTEQSVAVYQMRFTQSLVRVIQ